MDGREIADMIERLGGALHDAKIPPGYITLNLTRREMHDLDVRLMQTASLAFVGPDRAGDVRPVVNGVSVRIFDEAI